MDNLLKWLQTNSPLLGAFASIGALIFSWKNYWRLSAQPALALDIRHETAHNEWLRDFKLIIRNNGRKSAEDVRIKLRKPVRSGHEIRHDDSEVLILTEDSTFKGILFKYPGWNGHEESWSLKQTSLHPGQEVTIATVFIYPEWEQWGELTWTSIDYLIVARDTLPQIGIVHVPLQRNSSYLWVAKMKSRSSKRA